jgi:hypothetical protein
MFGRFVIGGDFTALVPAGAALAGGRETGDGRIGGGGNAGSLE